MDQLELTDSGNSLIPLGMDLSQAANPASVVTNIHMMDRIIFLIVLSVRKWYIVCIFNLFDFIKIGLLILSYIDIREV